MPDDLEALGAFIAQEVERRVQEALGRVSFSRTGKVADAATIGTAATRTYTGPNGDNRTEAAVWVNEETQTADTYIWLPVLRGVTVAEGDYVLVQSAHPFATSGAMWVAAKL